ncbi:MAG TPA: DUF6412 domain-containing protein [Streptosporangiaceae bacterium]|jgi:hypothetical protein
MRPSARGGQAALGVVLVLLADLWLTTGHLLSAPFGLSAVSVTMLAGSVLLGGLAAHLASGARFVAISAAIPLISHAAALREKSWHAAFLRQRDPDAAGRPKPRAPSAA